MDRDTVRWCVTIPLSGCVVLLLCPVYVTWFLSLFSLFPCLLLDFATTCLLHLPTCSILTKLAPRAGVLIVQI